MQKVNKMKLDRKISVTVSFLQLYNEKIFDLLNREMFKPNKKSKMVFNFRGNIQEGLRLKWN